MKLTSLEMQLITNAFKNVQPEDKKFLEKILITLAKKHTWFKENLLFVINKGVVFTTEPYDHPAAFHYLEKKIIINSNFLVKNDYLYEALQTVFSNTIPHELTHAFEDASFTGISTYLSSLFERVFIGNQIINELSCIDQTKKVNSMALAKLSSFISSQKPHLEIMVLPIEGGYRTKVTDYITLLGACPLPSNHTGLQYITDILPISDTHVISSLTYDQVKIKGLFNATKSARNSNSHLEKNIDFPQLTLWSELNETLRSNLDILYLVTSQIVNDIVKDNKCYPAFLDCLEKRNKNCLVKFTDCQIQLGMKQSASEVSANLQAFFDIIPTIEMLSELCTHKPVLFEETFQTQSFLLRVLPCNGVSCFGYSFIDTIAERSLQKINYRNIYKTMINLFYMLITNSLLYYIFADEDTIPLQSQLLFASAIVLLNNMSPTSRHLLTSMMFCINIFSEGVMPTIATIGVGSASSYFGEVSARSELLTRSMERAFGWGKIKTTNVVDIENNDSSKTQLAKKHR